MVSQETHNITIVQSSLSEDNDAIVFGRVIILYVNLKEPMQNTYISIYIRYTLKVAWIGMAPQCNGNPTNIELAPQLKLVDSRVFNDGPNTETNAFCRASAGPAGTSKSLSAALPTIPMSKALLK
ncbi:hypothetical protein TWF481_005594 [Arthrobotrys musiformis]|uniref:Uncharacterized protein n=1 Tax=Arthrobotrys musiformis TaxID=47236 RepID=A0AAV9WGC5_9PEZI